MTHFFKLYLITLGTFLVIDIAWIGFMAQSFYQEQLGHLMAPSPNWLAAILFYLLFTFGLLFFVILPGVEKNDLKQTISRAALFGLITYGAYDLTNLATLRDWPVTMTVVDMIWGTVLSSLVSLAGFMAGKGVK